MKIFFSDMDGTLLNTQKQITPRTKAALDAFTSAGNRFVISTGRPFFSARFLRDSLRLRYPGSFLSAFNGSLLYDNDKKEILYQTGIPLPLVPRVLSLADEYGIYVHAFQGDYVVTRSDSEEFLYYTGFTHLPGLVQKDILPLLKDPPCKMLALELHEPEKLKAFAAAFEKEFRGVLSCAFSAERHLEIYPASSDKGKALRFLCERLDVPLENTIAAGDEGNDIPAIRTAGLGIAMCNGSDATKAAADVITKEDNDHDGLAPFLESCM